MKKRKGISLIILVITILVMLILAGIVIASLMGENNPIARAKESRDKYNEKQKIYQQAIDYKRVSSAGGMQEQEVSKQDSMELLVNPDRGFYQYAELKLGETGFNTGSLSYYMQEMKTNFLSLAQLNLDIGYLSGRANGTGADKNFTQAQLATLDTVMQRFRDNKYKVVVRFAYNFPEYNSHTPVDQYANKEPSSITKVCAHITQLKEFFAKHRDVITAVDAGFLGPNGSMHTSSIATDANIKKVLDTYEQILPPEMFVNIRKPITYMNIYSTNPVTLATAFKPEMSSRVGFHNDSLFNSETDSGTYPSGKRKEHINWLDKHARYTFTGGETTAVTSYSDAANVLEELPKMHIQYLNQDMQEVMTKWKNTAYTGPDTRYHGKTLYDYVQNYLGYRFFVYEAKNTPEVIAGGEFAIDFQVQNLGFANALNERACKLLLRKGNKYYKANIDTDVRTWEAGAITKTQVTMQIPDSIELGEWEIYIKVADKYNEGYVTRFANTGIYNEYLGANYLGKITVKAGSGRNKKFKQLANKYGDPGSDVIHTVNIPERAMQIDGRISFSDEWTAADIKETDGKREIYAKVEGDSLYVYYTDVDLANIANIQLRIATTQSGFVNGKDRAEYGYGIENGIMYKLDASSNYVGGNEVQNSGAMQGKAVAYEFKIPLKDMQITNAADIKAVSVCTLDREWNDINVEDLVGVI